MKTRTIKENKDFRRAYRRGRCVSGSVLVTYAVKNKENCTRVGITSAKKIGNAVKRNRARRIIRAAFSQLENSVCRNCDIVFVARTKTTFVKMQDVLKEMEKQLLQLGVIENEKAQ